MLSQLRTVAAKRPVLFFVLLALALSWLLTLPMTGMAAGWWSVPPWLHYLAAYSPALSALIVTGLLRGRAGLSDLWSRITRWQIGWRWLVPIGTPLGLFVLAQAALWIMNGYPPDLSRMGEFDYVGRISAPLTVLAWFLTQGLGEEIGWRGFAFHELRARGWAFAPASLLLGFAWTLWHLPYFIYVSDYIELGLPGFFGLAFSYLCGMTILGWMYEYTGESILALALWHAIFNWLIDSPASTGLTQAIMSVIVMGWAIVLIVLSLRFAQRQSEERAADERAVETLR